MAQITRDSDGTLPAHAWPGGYPIVYMTKDNACLCPACANGQNGSAAFVAAENAERSACRDDNQWALVAADVHWEGEPITCEHCNAQIESAYGPIDAE